jgi:hypothetical protein
MDASDYPIWVMMWPSEEERVVDSREDIPPIGPGNTHLHVMKIRVTPGQREEIVKAAIRDGHYNLDKPSG